jgi:PHD/YefM family antitoxin component YafN of YafNO toxin-antitoxin module
MQSKGRYDTLSMVEARDQLTRLPEMFEQMLKQRDGMPVIEVTRRNKPVLAILPWELFESILETLEVLEDDEQMIALHQALREVSAGQGRSWKKLKQEQGWDELDSLHSATDVTL